LAVGPFHGYPVLLGVQGVYSARLAVSVDATLVLSLHPHQPGVRQVVEVVEVVEVVVVLGTEVRLVVVVVSSRHPNHPGVSHVLVVSLVVSVVVSGLE
jgi:hypothetical protein